MGPASGDEPEKGLAPVAMKQELEPVLDYYTLGKLRDAQRAERGFVNDNWIVETTRGRYFLKRRHPRLRQPEFIRGQHELIGWLRQAGFPTPTIVPTARGETFLTLDGEVYEIYVYVEHEPYNHERPAHLKEAALTLGRYHTILHGFAPETLRPSGGLYRPNILSTILTNLSQAWQLDQDPELADIAHQFEAQAADLAARFAEHGALPHMVIHGDYYADNLLFKGDRIVCVVDYDKASWQPRVVELAEALIYFASPRPGHLKYLVYPGYLDWTLFSRFVQNYVRAAIPGGNEVRALPDYIQCIWVSVSLKRLLEEGPRPAEAPEALQEVLALSAWAHANADSIIEASHSAIAGSQAATE